MRLKSFFFLFFLIGALGFTQAPEKFTYQSVIKNSSGYLLKNQEIGLRISILFNSSNGMSVYSEEHSVESNSNGLVTLIIGEGVTSDVFNDIDWGNGEYYLKVEVDPEGGINYTMNQTSQLLSVPYALYARNSSVNLSVIGQSYITYSGNQISVNKIDASNDITGLSAVAISGEYNDLANTPILFDGDYTSLTNAPTLFDGDYANLTNTPTLFDGDYANLTNKPELEDGKIYIGDSDNKSVQVSVTGDVAITNAGVTSIGAQKVVNSMLADDAVGLDELANITEGSILTGDSSNNPLLLDANDTGKILIGTGTGLASVAISGDFDLASNGTVTIANNAVDLTSKVTGTLPIANGGTGGSTASAALNSLGIMSGIHTWSASPSTSQTVTLSGVSSSSIIIVTMNGTGNNQFLKNVVPGSNEFTINMNGDPGDGTKFSYIVITP